GDHLAYVGIVGTGYGEVVVKRLMPALKTNAASQNPFGGANVPKKAAGIHWLKPKLVAEIEFAGFTGDGMIRQAAFKGLRTDKSAEDVVADEPAVIAAAKPAAKRRGGSATSRAVPVSREGGSAAVLGVAVSKPGKALWPDGGDGKPVTKLDLAEYMEAVGETL